MWVRFSDVEVEYEGPIDYNEYLRPAYALTVNKAQAANDDCIRAAPACRKTFLFKK